MTAAQYYDWWIYSGTGHNKRQRFAEIRMRSTWRRFWPVIALALVGVIALAVHLVVNHLTREPPNYSQIEDGLWLGGQVVAPPPGTRAVLNLCESEDPYQTESHRWEPIRDAEPAPSLAWLRQQVDFIESERAGGKVVYVHCRNGVSRSGMVLAAYLMPRERWSRDEALDFLRSRRPGVRPNPVFLELLLEWERSSKGQERSGKSARDLLRWFRRSPSGPCLEGPGKGDHPCASRNSSCFV